MSCALMLSTEPSTTSTRRRARSAPLCRPLVTVARIVLRAISQLAEAPLATAAGGQG
jgi:hypothetical protein